MIALLDHTKFGRQAVATITRMQHVHTLITDATPPEGVLSDLTLHQTELIITP